MKFYFAFSMLILFSCKKELPKDNNSTIQYTYEYSTSFSVKENSNSIIISYVDTENRSKIPKNILPITSCLVMNTSSVAFMDELKVKNTILGVASPEYIYNSAVSKKVLSSELATVGNDVSWDFEKIIGIKPQLIFANYNPNLEKTYLQLEKNGIVLVFIDEFKENHPLGRSEYIKLFGKLFSKEKAADSIFNSVKNRYISTKNKAKSLAYKPKILSKILYGDIWYMPGGESYTSTLYKDAGGDYAWGNTSKIGSLLLNFEEVFSTSAQADIWMDVSNFSTIKQLENTNNLYSNFKSFKDHQLYAIAGKVNGKANDFYESGVIRADKVLEETYYIFENYSNLNTDSLYYYKKLE